MKLVQLLVLVVVASLTQVYAKQEVDPDHFDQGASHTVVQKSHASHVHAQQHHHQKLASKHAGRAHHHRSHAAA